LFKSFVLTKKLKKKGFTLKLLEYQEERKKIMQKIGEEYQTNQSANQQKISHGGHTQ